jgi:CheY-like chemotaxis protein
MTRILLAEHSPHAQRMAERILREEGYTVITVSDGDTAMLRLKDANPRLVLADVALRGHSGFDICTFVKTEPDFAGTAVVLSFGALETVDDEAVKRVRADGVLRKPFEASDLLEMAARYAPATRESYIVNRTEAGEKAMRQARPVVVLDPDQVRAAVTVALDEALEPLIDRVTERVIAALGQRSLR